MARNKNNAFECGQITGLRRRKSKTRTLEPKVKQKSKICSIFGGGVKNKKEKAKKCKNSLDIFRRSAIISLVPARAGTNSGFV